MKITHDMVSLSTYLLSQKRTALIKASEATGIEAPLTNVYHADVENWKDQK